MSGIGGLPPIPTYLSIIKDESATAAKVEAGDPATQLALKHFTAVAPTLKTPQQLLGDYRALSVVLGAFGMSSAIGQTAILRKLMTQDPTSKTSLAQTSGNALWQRFAAQMSNWTATATPFSTAANVAAIGSQFVENAFETREGAGTPGLQQALYFTRTIKGDAGSLDALMSDQTNLGVVETVSGLDPTQFGALDFDEQQRILKGDVKLATFSSTASIQRYAEQYLALTAIDPPSTAASWSTANLFEEAPQESLLGLIGASLSVSA